MKVIIDGNRVNLRAEDHKFIFEVDVEEEFLDNDGSESFFDKEGNKVVEVIPDEDIG